MSSLTARVYDFLPTTSAITGYAEDKECSFSGVTSIRQTLEAGAERLGLEFSGKRGLEWLGCAGKRGLQWLGVCRKARLAVAWGVPESEACSGLECAGKRGLGVPESEAWSVPESECGTSPVCRSELVGVAVSGGRGHRGDHTVL